MFYTVSMDYDGWGSTQHKNVPTVRNGDWPIVTTCLDVADGIARLLNERKVPEPLWEPIEPISIGEHFA